jgi:predicted nucleotidyltransferase
VSFPDTIIVEMSVADADMIVQALDLAAFNHMTLLEATPRDAVRLRCWLAVEVAKARLAAREAS